LDFHLVYQALLLSHHRLKPWDAPHFYLVLPSEDYSYFVAVSLV
jgi:hypothetical protein